MGLDTKSYWLTDHQLQCDFDFDSGLAWLDFISFSRVEAGLNTSIVTLRVVGGDEKRSLISETVRYGLESQGTRARERLRWQGQAAYEYTKDRPVLSSEREPHKKQDRNCQTIINIWSWATDGARHQDLLIDRHSQCDFDFVSWERVLCRSLWRENLRELEPEADE
jgi:hypothetical protein